MTTFIGKEVTLIGKQPQVGELAPNFSLMANDLTQKQLTDFSGIKVLSVVPSIDTGICSAQTRRFNQELSDRDGVTVITVSANLPFAQARFCGTEGLDNAITLSDYYDHTFGKAYGLLMEEWNLLARAVLVLDADNKIIYTEYLENVNEHPNYEAALAVVK
ncbi:thiol peroxidase [Streptococcus gallinaceus]|uniref:thiol peroxidase n=1 Tax=Streptococcus gallinaceus TaxID=165758 RepID=UPI00209DCF83|nr:thiol peroxidase [Streptococcus gallinaceus]MCP1638948.1 thiol peroxidase [Streptococcus gallinaceus]